MTKPIEDSANATAIRAALDVPTTADLSAVDDAAQAAAAAAAAKYTKPSTGIPASDLAAAAQTSLGKADSAIQDLAGMTAKFNAGTAPEKAAFQSSVSGGGNSLTPAQTAAGAVGVIAATGAGSLILPDGSIAAGGSATPVVDNLTTSSAASALSAKQGVTLAAALATKPDMVRGRNLFDKATGTAGSFMGPDGSIGSSANYILSDFIAVTPGTQYYGRGSAFVMGFHCFFTSAKTVLAGGSNADANTFTPPANAAFVKVTVYAADTNTFQLEVGSAATPYQAYGWYFSFEAVNAGQVSTQKVADQAITPIKTNFLQLSKNLFNEATITAGYFQGANGIPTANATLNTSDFIAVTPGTQYYCRSATQATRMLTYYNAAKAVLAGGSDNNISTFTPPVGAAFVKVTVHAATQASYQLEQGSAASAFVPFGYTLQTTTGEPIHFGRTIAGTSKWVGKTWFSIGDSINSGGTWQPAVIAALGLAHTNLGVGGSPLSGAAGSTTAMCQDARINAAPTTADLITLSPGTNDWAQNTPMGAVDSTDPLTFNGAFNTFMAKAMARWPGKRIVVGTTPYGEIVDYAARGWPNVSTNTLGFTTRDYAAALIVQCGRYGLPHADISGRAGWNSLNIQSFMTEPDRLHPTATGGARMAAVWIAALKACEPVT